MLGSWKPCMYIYIYTQCTAAGSALATASLRADNIQLSKLLPRNFSKLKMTSTELSLPLVDVKEKLMEENTLKGKAHKYNC